MELLFIIELLFWLFIFSFVLTFFSSSFSFSFSLPLLLTASLLGLWLSVGFGFFGSCLILVDDCSFDGIKCLIFVALFKTFNILVSYSSIILTKTLSIMVWFCSFLSFISNISYTFLNNSIKSLILIISKKKFFNSSFKNSSVGSVTGFNLSINFLSFSSGGLYILWYIIPVVSSIILPLLLFNISLSSTVKMQYLLKTLFMSSILRFGWYILSKGYNNSSISISFSLFFLSNSSTNPVHLNSNNLNCAKVFGKSFIIKPIYDSEINCSFSFINLSLSFIFILPFLFCSSIAIFSKSFSIFIIFSFLCLISFPISDFSFIGKSFRI